LIKNLFIRLCLLVSLFIVFFTLSLFGSQAEVTKEKAKNQKDKIICLISDRKTEVNGKLEDLKQLYEAGLITLNDATSYKEQLAELEQFEFTINNPMRGSYEETLGNKLKFQLSKMQADLEIKKQLWNEGLVATKEVEELEEKAALYNYFLEYLSDKGRFIDLASFKGNLSILKILDRFYPISSLFGFRNDPIGKGRKQFHSGIDFATPSGTPVKAPIEGKVIKIVNSVDSGGGRQIRLSHSTELETAYLHLSKIVVTKGQIVKEGSIIGYSGNTGYRTTGPHLHFEVHWKGIPIDPMKFLKK
jgi:murein DD-endopeptidase MepM/ murein hydrolase activator NlpD